MILMRTRAVVALVALMFSVGAASAAQGSLCQQLITDLIDTTQTVQLTGRKAAKDLSGLTMTLEAASETLADGKRCDSIKKLEDFKVKVDQLIVAGRFDTGEGRTAEELLAQTDAAIACINGEATAAGGSCTF
jgi:uncharacterized cupredoxin-like copper-binding protein